MSICQNIDQDDNSQKSNDEIKLPSEIVDVNLMEDNDNKQNEKNNDDNEDTRNYYYIKSQRKANLLCHKGYIYSARKKVKEKIYWYCTYEKNHSCKGRGVQYNNDKFVTTVPHNHAVDIDLIEARNFVNRMKNESKQMSDINVAKMVREESLKNATSPFAEHLPKYKNLVRTIQRSIKRSSNNPVKIEDLQLDKKDKFFDNGERFLQKNSEIEIDGQVEKIYIFYKTLNLFSLKENKIWAIDSISNVPKIFKKLIIINVIVNNKNIPMVYALCTTEHYLLYEELFKHFKLTEIVPNVVISEFDTSMYKALTNEFPSTKIKGCCFHFVQALFEEVKKITSKNDSKSLNLSNYIYIFVALSFVSINELRNYFEKLVLSDYIQQELSNDQAMHNFIDYFQKNFLGYLLNGVYYSPYYDYSIWNQIDNVIYDLQSINNAIEGFNISLASFINKEINNIHNYIDKLKFLSGYDFSSVDVHSRRTYKKRSQKLNEVLWKKASLSENDFLRQISAAIRMKLKVNPF